MMKWQDSGCNPYSCILEQHRQRCGVQTRRLRRIETARRELSLSSRHPIAVLGRQFNQAPDSIQVAATKHARRCWSRMGFRAATWAEKSRESLFVCLTGSSGFLRAKDVQVEMTSSAFSTEGSDGCERIADTKCRQDSHEDR